MAAAPQPALDDLATQRTSTERAVSRAPEPFVEPSPPAPNRSLPTAEIAREESSAPATPGLGTWLLRVLVITLVAFAVGAGAAVAWVQLLR